MIQDRRTEDGWIDDRYRKNDRSIDDNKAKVSKCQQLGNLDKKDMALGDLDGSVGGAHDLRAVSSSPTFGEEITQK